MSRALKTFIQGLTVFLLLSCGCCGFLVKYVDFEESGDGTAISASGPRDLGTAAIPVDAPIDDARRFPWDAVSLQPRHHVVGYKLSTGEMTRIAADHLAFGRKLNYRRVGDDLMVFEGPDDCMQHLGCVYDRLQATNASTVVPLAQRFVEEIRSRNLSVREGTELIVTFVQSLEYRLPKAEPFGILPPALVLAQGWGDCDSKALLAVMMLEQIGVDAVVLTSAVFKHAAVGIDFPGSDTRFRGGGRHWQFVEITSTGWPIGKVPPEVDIAQLWTVVPMSAGPVKALDAPELPPLEEALDEELDDADALEE